MIFLGSDDMPQEGHFKNTVVMSQEQPDLHDQRISMVTILEHFPTFFFLHHDNGYWYLYISHDFT